MKTTVIIFHTLGLILGFFSSVCMCVFISVVQRSTGTDDFMPSLLVELDTCRRASTTKRLLLGIHFQGPSCNASTHEKFVLLVRQPFGIERCLFSSPQSELWHCHTRIMLWNVQSPVSHSAPAGVGECVHLASWNSMLWMGRNSIYCE